jgi:hypothetical protein
VVPRAVRRNEVRAVQHAVRQSAVRQCAALPARRYAALREALPVLRCEALRVQRHGVLQELHEAFLPVPHVDPVGPTLTLLRSSLVEVRSILRGAHTATSPDSCKTVLKLKYPSANIVPATSNAAGVYSSFSSASGRFELRRAPHSQHECGTYFEFGSDR